MNVDIQQILTHIVGFLIALWILRRFAWKPLLGVLEERRRKIKSDFEAAEDKRREAEESAARYAAQLKDIETEARQKIQEAVTEGRRIAGEIREEARAEAHKIIEKARADLQRDLAKARVELKDQIVGMTVTATERIIRQSIDQEGQRRLIARFVDELESTPGSGVN
jgi:F-type H+-transporting ATPase subunit b